MRNHPAAELFPMLSESDLASLAANIKTNGLRQPIVVFNGAVLDGRNRLAACERAQVEPRFIDFIGSDPWQYVWDLNAERRHLEPFQKAALAVKFAAGSADHAREQARRREEANASRSEKLKGVPRADRPAPTGAPLLPPAKAAVSIAAQAKVAPRTVERAIELQRKAPGVFEAVCRGEVPGRRALTDIKRTERTEKLAGIARGNAPLPVGKTAERYAVLYADPPWRYEHVETESRAIENQYPTMALDEICALPVSALATQDALLFLWATSPKLEEAMRVVAAWGFTYRTSMVWVKDRVGMGYYARQRHELLLIATRGNPPTPAPADRPDSVLESPRGEHSAKPDAFAEVIERMYPTLPRVEMFGRKPRPGWDVWGNQARGAA